MNIQELSRVIDRRNREMWVQLNAEEYYRVTQKGQKMPVTRETDVQFANWLFMRLTESQRQTLSYLLECSTHAVYDATAAFTVKKNLPWSWEDSLIYREETQFLSAYLS